MNITEEIDRIYDTLDELFSDGKFDEGERFMRANAIETRPTAVLLSLLTISSPVPESRTSIHAVRADIAAIVRRKARDAQHADDLLRGLI